jgi:hypothetical protein
MKAPARYSLLAPVLWALLARLALAQEGPRTEEVPTAMGAHTWFILAFVGAFLAWSISYSLQLQKEAANRRKGRESLLQRKEEILGQIADLEERKRTGDVSEQRYKQDFKALKHRLAKILESLGGGTTAKKAR